MSVELNCKEVSRLISQGFDHAIPAAEGARLRHHFSICQTCRTVEEQLKFLRRAIKAMEVDRSPSR